MSIKKLLQRSILLMTVVPVILITISAYLIVANRYASNTKENTQQIVKEYSYFFSSHLQSQIIETITIANNTDIKSCLLEKVNLPDSLFTTAYVSYKNINDFLTQISENYSHDVNYYVYDIDGYLIGSTEQNTNSDWNEIMQSPVDFYSKTTIIPNSNFTTDTLDIIEPVIVKNQVIGLIRSNISSNYFETVLSNTNEHYILEENGKYLFGYMPTAKDNILSEQLITSESNNNFSKENTGIFCDGINDIYGYSSIPGYDWIYIIKQDTSDFISIISILSFIFFILLIIVIIVSIHISQSLAEKYTQPLLTLCQKMQLATDGQLDVRYETTREDEFGILSTSFNQMMEIISTNYNELSASRKKLEESQNQLQNNYRHIEELAFTDALTGLYNRMAFFSFATKILSENHGGIQEHAVIFIDLDGFKAINDTLGHDYGDLLLQSVAQQLSSLIQKNDILARNGGDEFVILRNHISSMAELKTFLDSLISIGTHPFILEDETIHITISAGVALFPKNGLSLSELMKNADIAMYTSKFSGKNSYTFFNSTMEDEVNRRNDLIDILRNAIANKEVYLLYQPQADVSTGEIIGYEALMRLNSPLIGFVSPDEFIPIAEECGLIDELGEWALVEACNFNQRIIDAGFKPLRVSVNVSTAQLHNGSHLLKAIKSIPQQTSMPLKYLEIELTESVMMKNFDHNLALINQMKELGVHIALDDFGTGYSSFSYLTRIPFNSLKIDKSFIAGICENTNDSYIAGTIINLAHQLGITVIAEGVETIEQLRILQSQMCDILQGYLFSQAITEEEFIELLRINS